MTGLEIALFILATAFIVISFFIVDNSSKTKSQANGVNIDPGALKEMQDDFSETINKEADIILHETEGKLEEISNDKIMAVGEYSDQIIEKINTNHQEVVFLYQMLKDKEEELKSTAQGLENMRIECEKLILESANRPKSAIETLAAGKSEPAPAKKPVVKKTATKKTATADASAVAAVAAKSDAKKNIKVDNAPGAPEALDTSMLSRNDQIIALYKSKKSVMEISKLLGMGQGEVKLIIDLYCK